MADQLPYLQGPGTAASLEDTQKFDEADQASRLANIQKQNDLLNQTGAQAAQQAYLSQLSSNQDQVGQAHNAAASSYSDQNIQPLPKDTTQGAPTPASITSTTASPTYQPPQSGLASQTPAVAIPPATVAAVQQLTASPQVQKTINNAATPTASQPVPPPTSDQLQSATINANNSQTVSCPAVVRSTPFDSDQFMQKLTAKLGNTPGAAQELMRIKEQRDQQLGNIFQMAANGSPDEAKYLASQMGFNIPDHVIQDANTTQGLNFSQKAYPDEPDKGMAFFKAYTGTGGSLDDKIQAGVAAAGMPTGLAQRELNKAIALSKATVMPIYTKDGGMMVVHPWEGTASTVINDNGQNVTGIVGAGKNLRESGSSLTNAGVKVPMTEYQRQTLNNKAAVQVDNMIRAEVSNGAPAPTSIQRSQMIADEVQRQATLGLPPDPGAAASPPSSGSGLSNQLPAVPSAVPPAPSNGTPITNVSGPAYAANDTSLPAIAARGDLTTQPATQTAPNGQPTTVQTPAGTVPNPAAQTPTAPRASSYTLMLDPKGNPAYVPNNRVQAAIQSGGKLMQ